MIQIMHWVVKSNRKTALLKADSISISVDDRGDFRMMRYRCSYVSPDVFHHVKACFGPAAPAAERLAENRLEDWCSIDPVFVEGVLGVVRNGRNVAENTIAEHDRDKSEKMAESMMEALKDVCVDMDGNLDEEAFHQICSKVQHYASDQGAAAAKCGQLLSQQSQQSQQPQLKLIWVSADMAHQVRIATKDPLHAVEGFQVQWDRLFSGRHALVPDIQHSEVWRSRLIAAQKEVLRSCQTQGADVNKVLQTFSFAKQRFDSTATPMLKYCCMVRAIALVCAMQAGDDPQVFLSSFSSCH